MSCTPAGIEALLAHYGIPVAGREVVHPRARASRSDVRWPCSCSQKRPTANAAVTVVHTGVPDWPEYTRRADIVVAAAGVPGILQPEHLTPGCAVVGAGVRYEGRTLLPDVDEACDEVAGHITPRVGGVGPTTIAMLFRNFVEAAERRAARMAAVTRIGDLLAAGPDVLVRVRPAPHARAGGPARRRRCVELEPLEPSFVSVTYGALGSTRDTTARIVDHIATNTSMTVMPHLTCVGHTRGRARGDRRRLPRRAASRTCSALGGDPPEDGSDLADRLQLRRAS